MPQSNKTQKLHKKIDFQNVPRGFLPQLMENFLTEKKPCFDIVINM